MFFSTLGQYSYSVPELQSNIMADTHSVLLMTV